jgi:hypothetical protein
MTAFGVNFCTRPERQYAAAPMAFFALVFVNWHRHPPSCHFSVAGKPSLILRISVKIGNDVGGRKRQFRWQILTLKRTLDLMPYASQIYFPFPLKYSKFAHNQDRGTLAIFFNQDGLKHAIEANSNMAGSG